MKEVRKAFTGDRENLNRLQNHLVEEKVFEILLGEERGGGDAD